MGSVSEKFHKAEAEPRFLENSMTAVRNQHGDLGAEMENVWEKRVIRSLQGNSLVRMWQ